ncbi:DNA internalization-related competence protein ComEC/Rec2 [Paucibacter soli]|uniref:DNA internalization-related competence protein ComEC/Rec2 n=1 Tax=Paucibacter soli TaxID=3133433 RepID=UPI00309A712D
MHRAWTAPRAWHGVLLMLSWLGGLALLQQCARLPAPAELAGLLLLVGLALGLARLLPAWRWGLIALALALLAFLQGAWRAEQRLALDLPSAWEGQDLLLRGRIASLPQAVQGYAGAPGWRFEFEPEPAPSEPLHLPSRLLLSWYGEAAGPAPAVQAGERWQLPLRLRRVHGLANPFAFDHELWMFERGLRATGVVRQGSSAAQRLAAAPWWALLRWRQALRSAIQQQLGRDAAASAGVLAALSLGDQAAITRHEWELFRDTSVAHLMSISGLHVTMFAWLAAGLAARLWRRSAWLCLRLPAPLAATALGVLAAWAYALFSGWAVPSQRTVWMLLVLALLRLTGWRWPWPMCLLASACVVTLLDPWAIAQPGFWLSFAAVGLLMGSGGDTNQAAGSGLAKTLQQSLRQALHGQWVATLGLAPLTLLFFQQLSLVGLLANLLAIPLVSFVITPLALLGAASPWLWQLDAWIVKGLLGYLEWLASWPLAVWRVPVAPAWAQLLGLLGGALLVLPLPWRARGLGLLLLVPLLWPAPARPGPGEFELLAADIGQGNAVLVRTAGHALLYDAGPQYAPGVDAGQRVLLPLLRAIGQGRLDLLLLSHRDQDHVGGAGSLLAGLPIAGLLSSLESEHPLLQQGGPPAQRCERGQRWIWDGVQFELLHPSAADYGQQPAKSNARSCVLRISTAGGRSALLTGDIEAAQEALLLQREGAAGLASEVLLVPHHGSKTSSTEAFVAAVAPRLAIVQAGYRNRFGHPALPSLARYQAQGSQLLTSPSCGAWGWRSRDGAWWCQRERERRYWHWRDDGPGPSEAVGPELEVGYGF